MFFDRTLTLLDTAADDIRERIRRDRQRAPRKLQPMLEHLETHLFHPDLTVAQMKRVCGVRDNSIVTTFHSALGMAPRDYIATCRLETAARLLRDTELKVWQIAELVGYSGLPVFSRAFARWSKLRPRAYRRQVRTPAADSGAEARSEHRSPTSGATHPEDVASLEYWRQALYGELDAHEAQALIRHLRELYPEVSEPGEDPE